MAFATGKFSYSLCDFCGQRYPYKVLKKNWRGFMVCPDDYEPKEPQLQPLRYNSDAIALQDPRVDRIEPQVIFAGVPGDSAFQSIGSANGGTNMRPFPQQNAIIGVGSVGIVTIVIT